MGEIYTIGHSTRTLDALIGLLRGHGVKRLVDVRTVPRARRYPHFDREALPWKLARGGVAYTHMPALGGFRRPRKDSPNGAWRNPGFRGFADYMATEDFKRALGDLAVLAEVAPIAILCAEAVPWRCHRSLIADALLARGRNVGHILGPGPAAPHVLTPFARVRDGAVLYPPARAARRRSAARPVRARGRRTRVRRASPKSHARPL